MQGQWARDHRPNTRKVQAQVERHRRLIVRPLHAQSPGRKGRGHGVSLEHSVLGGLKSSSSSCGVGSVSVSNLKANRTATHPLALRRPPLPAISPAPLLAFLLPLLLPRPATAPVSPPCRRRCIRWARRRHPHRAPPLTRPPTSLRPRQGADRAGRMIQTTNADKCRKGKVRSRRT